jgi:hypothetical protein
MHCCKRIINARMQLSASKLQLSWIKIPVTAFLPVFVVWDNEEKFMSDYRLGAQSSIKAETLT